ncbi:Optic atrophy 3 protein (OPA3), putative [Trypanosoma equiperdum]|uniref:Optic atrophy 3 protein (OPA3) n=3 Tax=Trypanozoon TaxID=39700 RepID=Q384Y5_TRYB2|nr:hypothetical protein, conserved [Trypanosoma brucei brucei TREU927]EAN79646.1 hypothetical protein, conserved [Trypanosoma brucei brucei TREU927]SCU70786.1 Optic atrophy 3 protein (OPA3), putative [Trypanosoma equiperdum]
MPAPVYRFALLAIRQMSKPMVSRTVKKAQHGASITRTVCLRLGHLSAAISSVMARWHVEEKHKPSPVNSSKQDSATGEGSTSTFGKSKEDRAVTVAPRVRSLLGSTPSSRGGRSRSGRIFFSSRPMRTVWQTFREGYSASLSEEHLVAAGAELLIELLVYFILAFVLYAEITSSAKASEAKERRLLQRIDALEQKVNELVEANKHMDLAALEVAVHVEEPRGLRWVCHKFNDVAKKALGT